MAISSGTPLSQYAASVGRKSARLGVGDLYRCTSPSGALSFQDHPCTSGSTLRFPTAEDGRAPDEQALYDWLRQLPRTAGLADWTIAVRRQPG